MNNDMSPKAQSSRLRRGRGYRWEDTLVRRFRQLPSWRAFRLGSPSIALPDVLAVDTNSHTILVIEAKSGSKTTLMVPANQIQRCLDWCDTLHLYPTRKTILAFKFLSKKRLYTGQYTTRSIREYYKIWDPAIEPINCVCTYMGDIYALENGTRQPLELEEYIAPFQKISVSSE